LPFIPILGIFVECVDVGKNIEGFTTNPKLDFPLDGNNT
jgi:hypothetical protein